MNAYEKLQTARSQTRPTARSYIEKLFQERTELHGDRKYADDAAIIGGIGMLGDIPQPLSALNADAIWKKESAAISAAPCPKAIARHCA